MKQGHIHLEFKESTHVISIYCSSTLASQHLIKPKLKVEAGLGLLEGENLLAVQ